ncbi:MAG: hypothetical protein JXQ97_04905 [Natronospirillum sp.]
MEIKEFAPEFAAALSEIYLESRRSAFSWLDTSGFKLADFARDTDGERIWVCVKAGVVVGFISTVGQMPRQMPKTALFSLQYTNTDNNNYRRFYVCIYVDVSLPAYPTQLTSSKLNSSPSVVGFL